MLNRRSANVASRPTLGRRVDLTFKQNAHQGRHGWLRLTPAYSVALVETILTEFGGGARRVFEPFSGTGTTVLSAAYRGLDALGVDVNPFLVWLGRVKTASYSAAERKALEAAGELVCSRLRTRSDRRAPAPPLRNIERWWCPRELHFLTVLREELELATPAGVSDLLKVAFCRTMMALSNAAFNHPSMSFKPRGKTEHVETELLEVDAAFLERFRADVVFVARSVSENPLGQVRIERGDARSVPEAAGEPFDLLVTSPPYPNRISYIRELRPYMYWLGFLLDGRRAGELDWEAIGGTWGVATSRLSTWRPGDAFIPASLPPILDRIGAAHPKNGELMARYVHKYFHDMFLHFRAARSLICPGGTAHYVVGNSSFYGEVVPAERLYAAQLLEAGFRHVDVRVLRKRNSKRELFEFHVVGKA